MRRFTLLFSAFLLARGSVPTPHDGPAVPDGRALHGADRAALQAYIDGFPRQ